MKMSCTVLDFDLVLVPGFSDVVVVVSFVLIKYVLLLDDKMA